MSYTKRDLIEALKEYPDDILIEIGLPNSEPGTQHDIVDVVYATGTGRCTAGQSCVILEFDPKVVEVSDDENSDCECEELYCDICGTTILNCPNCGREL
jgi:hypothetical protein